MTKDPGDNTDLLRCLLGDERCRTVPGQVRVDRASQCHLGDVADAAVDRVLAQRGRPEADPELLARRALQQSRPPDAEIAVKPGRELGWQRKLERLVVLGLRAAEAA